MKMWNRFKSFAKGALVGVFVLSSSASAQVAMTADPSTGIQDIVSHADAALIAAIVIGTAVIGWGYVRSLIKRGK
jgi:hypothetical protein